MEETLGKRISAHRRRLGLTQEQLAEKLGVTAQAVSKWENDQSCPDITMLPRLAELFGTTTDALLGRESGPVYQGEVVREQPDPREEKDSWEFHWDDGRRHGILTALFVLLTGGLTLAARMLDLEVSFWQILWPTAMLVYGFGGVLRGFRFFNICCTLLGGYFLVRNMGLFDFSVNQDLIFPVLVLALGASLLFDALRKPKKPRFRIHKSGKPNGKTKSSFQQEGEYFNANVSFGDMSRSLDLPRLSGGEICVSFGEMDLDLTGCGEIAADCRIDVGVSFGEVNLRVPRWCRVEIESGSSFRSVEVHGRPDPDANAVIYVTGGVSFGELNICYV